MPEPTGYPNIDALFERLSNANTSKTARWVIPECGYQPEIEPDGPIGPPPNEGKGVQPPPKSQRREKADA